MGNANLLKAIQESWLSNARLRLARQGENGQNVEFQIERFFLLLVEAIELGVPGRLNPILNEWSEARTETELQKKETNLPPLLNQLFAILFETARDALHPEGTVDLMSAFLPVYAHCVEYVLNREVQLHVAHVTGELEKTRASLERLDKSKSDFISVAAHELKTPLTLIDGYAAMLREVMPPGREDQQIDLFLQGISNGTRRLHEIVEDMIDVSMIDNHLLSLNFQPVWLSRLLTIVRSELRPSLQARGQTLTIHRFPGSDEMIFGDGERLYQALKNVITNAVKYTPDGGRISVDGRKLPGFIEIIVIDNGIGIDPEDQLRIFEKFGRIGNPSLHSSGKTKFKGGGPGLGLPIAKGIIEAHGGTIWVESEGYDEARCPGSTFHILLPIRSEPPDDRLAKLFRPMREPYSSGNLD